MVYKENMPKLSQSRSTALREDIANSYHEHPASYFAAKHGIGLGAVYSIACRLGVSSCQRWDGEKETIVSMYEAGVPVKAIAKELGHFSSNVTKKLLAWGVSLRSLTEGRMGYQFDVDYFKTIDSHEKAYWLGFIYADGNIYLNKDSYKNVFQMALGKVDNGHLGELRKALKDSRPLYSERGGERYMINNIHFVNHLIRLGVTPRKSLTTEFPSEDQLPSQYVNSFILGYFDGDGSISLQKKRWSFSLVGTKPFLSEIGRLLEMRGLPQTQLRLEKRTGYGKIFYLTYGGSCYALSRPGCEAYRKNSLLKLYRFLYSAPCPYLTRKHEIFEKALINTHGHDWNNT